ncbi:MAG: Hsp20/alpha crystallin family protein [Deltaproteobacteria bacterium]|nr:Hsp20/alpha crystallin family protein [Deltaproteobacteria bacterium]
MYLTRWDPFETLTSLQEDIGRVFNSRLGDSKSLSSAWLPAVDISEDNESYTFDVEIPGLKTEDIHVKIENNALTIRGEKKSCCEDKQKNFHRIEREYGSFTRSFSLPELADVEKINAENKDGVLKIKVGKKEAAKPREVKIN